MFLAISILFESIQKTLQIKTSNAVIVLHDSFLMLLLGGDYGKNVVEDCLLIKNIFKAKKVDCMFVHKIKWLKNPRNSQKLKRASITPKILGLTLDVNGFKKRSMKDTPGKFSTDARDI